MPKNFLKNLYTKDIFYNLINIASRPWRGAGAILMYHRVLPKDKIDQDYDLGLAVTKSDFENQIKFLKSKYNIVSMDEFIDKLESRKKNEFFITITFDDGYKDNLTYAFPVLKENNVPATIYVTTRFLSENVWIWWYELKKTIDEKTSLSFRYKNKKIFFELSNIKQKNNTFKYLRKFFLNIRIEEQLKLLEIISQNKIRQNYSRLFLNSNDIRLLNNDPLITIGSHSHNHSNLKILKMDEAISEIKNSIEILEKIINKKIKHFAYPYGGKNEANSREYEITKNLKLNSAVTTNIYPVNSNKLFSLPRIYVGKNANEKVIRSHLTGFYNFVSKFI